MPHSLQTMSAQDKLSSQRYEESKLFCQATMIDYTDGGRNEDERKQLLSQAVFSDESVSDNHMKVEAPLKRNAGDNRSSSANVMSNSGSSLATIRQNNLGDGQRVYN